MTDASIGHFVQDLLIVPLTLLPIINPLSGAPVFMMMVDNDHSTACRMARQVAINCWFVIVGAMLIGTYVLALFGISLPIVRIAGGLLVAASGWQLLQRGADDQVRSAVVRDHKEELSEADIARRAFFPMTFPLTTGPGTIAASIALGASLPRKPALYAVDAFVAIIGATLTAAVIYLVYRNAPRLLGKLGEVGTLVMMRLLAFVLVCVGIQITWVGWAELNGLPLR